MWRDVRLIALLAVGSLAVMAGGVVAPILPQLIVALNVDPSVGGSLVSLHFLTVALSTPIWGFLANRFGHIPVMILSLVSYALFGVLGAFTQDLWMLMMLRGLLGVASGGIAATGIGLLGKLYTGEARIQAIAYVASTLTLANIVYPLMGGWIGSIHWKLPFGLYIISLPLSIWIFFVFNIKERKGLSSEEEPSLLGGADQALQIFTTPSTLKFLAALSIASGSVYAVVAYLPIYIQSLLDLGSGFSGFILSVQAIGAATSSAFIMRNVIRRFGTIGAIVIGLFLMALMLSLFPVPKSLLLLLVISILFGLGFGLVVPGLYNALADSVEPDNQSSILAVGTGASFLGQFLSPILLGILIRYSDLSTVFYFTSFILLLVGFGLMVNRKPSPQLKN